MPNIETDVNKSKSRAKYMELVSNRPEREKKEIIKALQGREKEIKKLSLKISEVYREYDELNTKLKQLEEVNEADYKQYGVEFDLLKSHSSIDNGKVYVRDNKIEIFTKRVVIRHEGDDYYIGRFLVILHLNKLNKREFECINLDRVEDKDQHPHIDVPWNVCFGSRARDEIKRYISGYRFDMAFHKIWCRLNIYTKGDQIVDIEEFPIIKSKKKK